MKWRRNGSDDSVMGDEKANTVYFNSQRGKRIMLEIQHRFEYWDPARQRTVRTHYWTTAERIAAGGVANAVPILGTERRVHLLSEGEYEVNSASHVQGKG